MGPPQCEKCGSSTFNIFFLRWARHLLHSVTVAFTATEICQQWELTFLSTVAFGATKILSAVGVDIPVDRSVQSYQNLVNFNSWHSCSFQSYLTPGRRYASHQLSKLTTVAFRAILKMKDMISSFFRSKFLLLLFLLWVTKGLLKTPGKNPFRTTAAKSFLAESFLIKKPWNFQQIYVRSLELPNYTIMLMSPLQWIIRFLLNVFSCHFSLCYVMVFTS